jgi:hypothetical protein
MLKGWTITLIVVWLAAAPAGAQTLPAARTFVDLTVGPDWDDAHNSGTRIEGATGRAGIAVGHDWGRSGLEIDVSVAQWHVGHLGPYRYRYGGPTTGWQRQGHFYESSTTVRHRSIDVMAFYRGNLPLNRHITFSWAAGGGYVYRPAEVRGVTTETLGDGQRTEVDAYEETSFRNYVAAAARIDVELRVAPFVSVVPRLRGTWFPSFIDDSGLAPRALVARPEVAVRWQF